MKRFGSAIFGLPLSNLSMDEIVQRCLFLMKEGRKKNIPHHITTFDTDFICRLYGWRPTTVLNPELLAVARKADISIASQKLITRLCSWLGSPVQVPMTSQQILLRLCQAPEMHDKGVFFIGGEEKVAKEVAVSLHESAQGIRLVGIASPPIHIEGEDLINAPERDSLLVEQINASNADLLVVNLGSPKQEIWFERVKRYLTVPLVFTVGDAFDILFQASHPLPGWENFGVDGDYEKNQKRGRWFRRIYQAFKIRWMALTLLSYHTINYLVYKILYQKREGTKNVRESLLFLSSDRSIAVISLPVLLDEGKAADLVSRFEEAAIHDVLVIDFSKVKHIQPEGFRLLIDIWRLRKEKNKEFYGYCPSCDIQCLMKLHHAWDLFKDSMCSSANVLMERLVQRGSRATFYDSVYQQGDHVIISILGALNNALDYDDYLNNLGPIIVLKDCTLDFTFCTLVDNKGFSFLLALRKKMQSQGKRLQICSLSPDLWHQFRLAGVDSLLIIKKRIEDFPSKS